MEKTAVVIVAAGNGERMGGEINKIFIELKGKPVLAHTISKFYSLDAIDEIVVALNPKDFDAFERLVREPYGFERVKVVAGGKDRQESAYNALLSLGEDTDYVLIHDGARPFVSSEVIIDCLEKARRHGAAVAALPSENTIKRSRDGEMIDYTPPRSEMFEAQTPQGFRYEAIMEANARRADQGDMAPVTDDASIAERAGYSVALSKGDKFNIKLTIPEDLEYAKVLAEFLSSE